MAKFEFTVEYNEIEYDVNFEAYGTSFDNNGIGWIDVGGQMINDKGTNYCDDYEIEKNSIVVECISDIDNYEETSFPELTDELKNILLVKAEQDNGEEISNKLMDEAEQERQDAINESKWDNMQDQDYGDY